VLFGLLLFNDAMGLLSWVGIGLIIASGITATILRHRANIATATPEPAEEF
jgi:multidrug transporter EmrE-like cation transporter